MKGIIANPGVAPYVQESVKAYQEANYLSAFYTTFISNGKGLVNKIISLMPGAAKRRNFVALQHQYLKENPLPEILRIFATKYLKPQTADKIWEWAELKFDKWVAAQLNKKIDFIHVYEHAALASLKKSKALGITSFYEQPSQHHTFFNDIVQSQWQNHPNLKTDDQMLLSNHKSHRRNKRRDEELACADYVICNSVFTKRTLLKAGIADEKIIVIPYGFPDVVKTAMPIKNNPEKLVFLYAGNLSLRKGIHILINAWKTLPNANNHELWLIGSKQLPGFVFENMPHSIKIKENMPHQDLLNLMRQADAFILPTLADGFGMVISEAMAIGLPVICTQNSGGTEIITHLQNGLIITAGDEQAIIESINWCIKNPNQLNEIGKSALKTAEEYPWSAYRKRLIEEISKRIN